MRSSLHYLPALALLLMSSSAMGASIAIESFAVEPRELPLGDAFEVRATVVFYRLGRVNSEAARSVAAYGFRRVGGSRGPARR